MTYLLNISFMFKEELEDAVMTWLNDEFIPVVTEADGFDKFEVFRLITPTDKDNLTFSFQIRSTNRKYLHEWFERSAIPVCEELFNRYSDGHGKSEVVIFPSMMESLG